MSARKPQGSGWVRAGFFGHYRYPREDARRIRELSLGHLGRSALGQVTKAARDYELEQKIGLGPTTGQLRGQLEALRGGCEELLVQYGAVDQPVDEVLHWEAFRNHADYWALRQRLLADLNTLEGLAYACAEHIPTKGGRPPATAPRKAFVLRLLRIWSEGGGPMRPLYVPRGFDRFAGPLADFVRAGVYPVLGPGHESAVEHDLEMVRRRIVRQKPPV